MLIIKSTNKDIKAVDRKKDIGNKLKDVQINQTLEAKNGNIVMKFESNSKLIEAKKKLDESKEEWFEPMVGTKLNPKIRICNVS